jgi:hypothetical protein
MPSHSCAGFESAVHLAPFLRKLALTGANQHHASKHEPCAEEWFSAVPE